MKKSFSFLTGALFLVFAQNIVSAQVKSAYNQTIDFHKYQTYSFGGWEKPRGQELNDLDKGLFQAAFQKEFAKRNMTFFPDNSDMVFTLRFVKDVATITHVDDDRNKPQNLVYDNTGLGFVNVLYQQEYEVGTVIVNIFDGETKEHIGQATFQYPLTKNQKKHDKRIFKAVKALMKKYPVVA
jgi:hypothetical protein